MMKTFLKVTLTVLGVCVGTTATAQEYNTERGFIHPGGLHTQADFDRIKQQLADGNEKVKAAYNVLKSAAYSQASAATYPVETIVRGGSGENYINAARGATIAYQNALRWKIDGTKANADHAVKVLMDWCNTTKAISGTSDQCLAKGLYGYEFAQAAELMRDYEGWSREDFHKFQEWMLQVWYPGCIGFLRNRNGTWENTGKWWQAPGHYWSNWGLCNALAVISIGVLCDDVFIYNQGMSFIKYDQVGTFKDPRTDNPILNDGLTEFWGNLVVTTTESELETGAYGKLGQTNESGRDTGHAAMALGLAIDIAHQGWNQGDDLFAYMDHRIAAGIEYVAAQTQSVEGLPWTNYKYGTNGIYYTDGRCWEMTAPALGAQMRPYWGTVIGHYEGVKGVKMPFSEQAYNEMGIDAGGQGSTSGGYDHLGYSVLMNTRNQQLATADQVPTELSPQITYNGKTIAHSELGGLTNTYQTTALTNRALAAGTVLTLSPQLPEGTTDTGNWQWNTGETTREITVTADRSFIYRATYTNEHGIESQICFPIAVQGDCHPTPVKTSITYNGTTTENATDITILYGGSVTLGVTDNAGYGNYKWSTNATAQSITVSGIRANKDVTCTFYNQGGCATTVTFHITVRDVRPDLILNDNTLQDTLTVICTEGDKVTLTPTTAATRRNGTWLWDNGSAENSLSIDSVETSTFHTVTYTIGDAITTLHYSIYVKDATDRLFPMGNYLIRHRDSGMLLTNRGDSAVLALPIHGMEESTEAHYDATQVWFIDNPGTARYDFISLADSTHMTQTGVMKKNTFRPHRLSFAKGTDYCAISNSSSQYWVVESDLNILYGTTKKLTDYPFELIPADHSSTSITSPVPPSPSPITIYDLSGRRLSGIPAKGFYISNGKKYWAR